MPTVHEHPAVPRAIRTGALMIALAAAATSIAAHSAYAVPDDARQVAAAAAVTHDGHAAPAAKNDTWRYRRHDGLWWYWTVADRWVYWVDNHWVDYDPKTYAELKTSRAPQTSGYARGGQGVWGQWGPVRYDRYGQPQYPYSMRTRGMKQLGPVPTPAGVRSLPGWGGER